MSTRGPRSLLARLELVLAQRPTLRTIVANTGWLFADRILRMIVGLLVGVWIARHLGPADFGTLSYALALASLATALATLGLDAIVVRTLVAEPGRRDEILGTVLLLRLAGSSLAVTLVGAAAWALRGGADPVVALALICASGFLFQAFDCIDLWFQARQNNRLSVLAKSTAFLTLAVAKVVLILHDAPLAAFAWTALAECAVGAGALLIAYRASGWHVGLWRARLLSAARLTREALPLMLSGVVIMVYMRVDQILLGEMLDQSAVGHYAAATRLVEASYLVPGVIATATSPALIRAHARDPEHFRRQMQRMFDLTVLVAYAIALPTTLLAEPLIELLYGHRYADAAMVLQIQVWALVFVALGAASGQYMIIERQNAVAFERTLVGAVLSVGLNLWLIPTQGTIGAACAAVASCAVANFFVLHRAGARPCFWMMVRALAPWRRRLA